MKISPDCYGCLQGLIRQAAGLATDNASLQQKAMEEATRILDSEFSYDQISIVIATKIHQVIKEITGNPDPYRTIKDREMEIARELYRELSLRAEAASRRRGRKRINLDSDDLQSCLKLAAKANTIDLFRNPGVIRDALRKPLNFVIDDSSQFETKLKDANKILYLADNAGEIYFDLPLIKKMRQFADVTYVVKSLPVQNDAALEDIRKAGLESQFGRIITTGTASPGIVFSLASTQFKQEFASADLIFAKGMGHYESLSELPRQGKFFYCLMAKCKPVAASLGVPLNSYVAMLP
jgi:damage-control phosphatase, subfamily I